MLRILPNYDKQRDMFVVVDQKEDMVEIRKMNEQLRMRTYHVKASQLIKVFEENQNPLSEDGSMDDSRPGGVKDQDDLQEAGASFPCQGDRMDNTRPGEVTGQ